MKTLILATLFIAMGMNSALAKTIESEGVSELTPPQQEMKMPAKKEQKVAGFYLGATIGNAREHLLFDNDAPYKVDKYSDIKTAYRFIAGYQFTRVIGVELDYTDYANYTITSPTSVTAQANLGYTFHNGLRIFTLQGLSKVYFNSDDSMLFKDDSATAWRTGGGIELAPASLNGLAFRASITYDIMAFDSTDQTNYTYSNWMLLRNMNVGMTYKF